MNKKPYLLKLIDGIQKFGNGPRGRKQEIQGGLEIGAVVVEPEQVLIKPES